jgi:hypothetical protein
METIDYSINDFLAYIMIYAADADFVITKEEEAHIRNVVGDNAYMQMLDLFDSHNDKETQEFISRLRKQYIDKDSNKDLLKIVKEVFLVDGYFAASEKALYEALKHLV